MRIKAASKTVLLTILVLVSLYLSYELWNQGWTTASSDTSYTPQTSTLQTTVPTQQHVISPYQVVLKGTSDLTAAVEVPGTSEFEHWVSRLSHLRLYNLHPQNSIGSKPIYRVDYQFGSQLTYSDILRWVPGVSPSMMPQNATGMTLYETKKQGPVMIVFNSAASVVYVGETDLDPSTFASSVHSELLLNQWSVWGKETSTPSYVPVNTVDMLEVSFTWQPMSVQPLVRSFFVNPQALTSVDEGSDKQLWTDGSRVVWWDRKNEVLTYADPNTPSSQTPKAMSTPEVLSYVQLHGGAPQSTLMFSQPSSDETQWTLIPYKYGFPILDQRDQIRIDVQGGHVVQYNQPLRNIVTGQTSVVEVMTAGNLKGILHSLMPTTSTDNITVQLGYIPVEQPTDKKASLVPAYLVSQSGIPLYEINAATGEVMKGMSVQ